jgi:aspartyl-tRNA(Asn)/glutamyl-tRNA(Gln) amidotransferase subunit B
MAGKYHLTVGLEIHAELKTATKAFSASRNDPFGAAEPNVYANPIDLGHPGTLPALNQEAVRQVIRVGLAIGGMIAEFAEFDRKHYFYPDIPKGYQISQYEHPLVEGGKIGNVAITRIHLEEDTATSKHDRGDFTLVDFNRAGVPLMELVTEACIHSADEAVAFAKDLQLLLRYLGASEANMERGEMRVEANISISDDPAKLGTKVEVKNLNSFRAVSGAIAYEAKRMEALLEAGNGAEIVQETRGWDEVGEKTVPQRRKETADDYRYFPEPDLPKLRPHEIFKLAELEAGLPELPWARRARYQALGLSEKEAEMLVEDLKLAAFVEESSFGLNDVKLQRLVANYALSDIVGLQKKTGAPLDQLPTAILQDVVRLIGEGKINSRVAKDLITFYWSNPDAASEMPRAKVEREGLGMMGEDALAPIVAQVLSAQPQAVADYKAGKVALMEFLVGQAMKETKGRADTALLRELLAKSLAA